MEGVTDGAVTGPTLYPSSECVGVCIMCVCVCVCTSQYASFHTHFLVSHWDLTTEWHFVPLLIKRSLRYGNDSLSAVQ